MLPRSLRLFLATVVSLASIAFVGPARASQVGFDGRTVSYTAAPGEVNSVSLIMTSFDASCGTRDGSKAGVGSVSTYANTVETTIANPSPSCVTTRPSLTPFASRQVRCTVS